MSDMQFWVSTVVIFATSAFVYGLKFYMESKELNKRRKGRS